MALSERKGINAGMLCCVSGPGRTGQATTKFKSGGRRHHQWKGGAERTKSLGQCCNEASSLPESACGRHELNFLRGNNRASRSALRTNTPLPALATVRPSLSPQTHPPARSQEACRHSAAVHACSSAADRERAVAASDCAAAASRRAASSSPARLAARSNRGRRSAAWLCWWLGLRRASSTRLASCGGKMETRQKAGGPSLVGGR